MNKFHSLYQRKLSQNLLDLKIYFTDNDNVDDFWKEFDGSESEGN